MLSEGTSQGEAGATTCQPTDTNPAFPPDQLNFELNGKRFAALGPAIPCELGAKVPTDSSLVTVIAAPRITSTEITKEWLERCLQQFAKCDVWNECFLQGCIFTSPKAQEVTPACEKYLKVHGCEWTEVMIENDDCQTLAPGPYYYERNTVRRVCRLVKDKCRAFRVALSPYLDSSSTEYGWLQPNKEDPSGPLDLAIPARIGSPLWLRVAVQDDFFVKDLKTSTCDEEQRETTDASSAFWGRLIKHNNYIIGFTEPSIKVEDFETAINPLEDGHESPAGTSNGSAADVMANEWLDCAVGADISGTGRRPAIANKVWQFRPSHDFIYPKGMYMTHTESDTPSVFSRKLNTLKRVMELWLPTAASTPVPKVTSSRHYKIIYLTDYLPHENIEQMRHIESFMNDLEAHLQATVQKLSIRESWKQSHPGRSNNHDESTHDVDGDSGASPKAIRHLKLEQQLYSYKTWLLDTLFDDENVETLIALPIANSRPNSDEDSSDSAENQTALDQRLISSLLGGPEIVVPIGEASYHSTTASNTEYVPVAVKILAAPGQDFELLHAIETVMTKSLRPIVVSTR